MKANFHTYTDETFVNRNGREVPYNHLFSGVDNETNRYSRRGGAELTREDIEDLHQDSCLKALASKESYDPDLNHGTPEAYGTMVVRRETWRSHAERLQRRTRAAELKERFERADNQLPLWLSQTDGGNHEPDRELESSEALAYINGKIDLLCEEQREVLRLKIDGKKPKQIAAELGLTANAVSSRLTRGTKRLMGLLGKEFLSDYGYSLCA